MRSETGEMFGSRRIASSQDVDHARQALSAVFLPVDFPSARTSNFDMQLNALTVGQITCGYMRFRDPVRIATAEAENFHIDIPTDGRATMRTDLGSPVYGTPDTAGIFMPGRPVDIDSGERFSQVSLMIPREVLQLEVENLLGENVVRPLDFSAELDLTTPAARMLMHAIRMIDEASDQDGGPLAHPLTVLRLEQVLMHSLLFAQPHNYLAALTSPGPDPVEWTPHKRECSLWQDHVGTSPLSTKTRP